MKQPERLIELRAKLKFVDDAQHYTTTIVVGLFKKELDCLRLMRVLRSNNPGIEYQMEDIVNPYIITKLMEDKNKIY